MIKLGKLDQTTSFEQKDKIMVRECRIIYKRKSAASPASIGQFAATSSINPRFYIDPNETVRRQNAEMIAKNAAELHGEERRNGEKNRFRSPQGDEQDGRAFARGRVRRHGSEPDECRDDHRATGGDHNAPRRMTIPCSQGVTLADSSRSLRRARNAEHRRNGFHFDLKLAPERHDHAFPAERSTEEMTIQLHRNLVPCRWYALLPLRARSRQSVNRFRPVSHASREQALAANRLEIACTIQPFSRRLEQTARERQPTEARIFNCRHCAVGPAPADDVV